MKIPKFKTKKELFAYLVEKEEDLIYAKKCTFKKADGMNIVPIIQHTKDDATKAEVNKSDNPGEIKVRAIINTTMVMDSHKDVHLNGLWKKSLKENSNIKHLQEHEMKFDKIIADKSDLKAFVKEYSWKDLGYDFEGKTEALVFDSTVKEKRNPYMFEQYKEGNVDNHSVGMWYVTIKMALNSDEEGHEKYLEEYNKNIDKIANKAEVEKEGYYYAVYEAKAIEGSAVPRGSNIFTPTVAVKNDIEVLTDEDIEAKALKEWLGVAE